MQNAWLDDIIGRYEDVKNRRLLQMYQKLATQHTPTAPSKKEEEDALVSDSRLHLKKARKEPTVMD